MKIDLAPGKFKILRGTILLIAVALLAYVGYAATTVSISNSGTVVLGTANWAGFTQNPGSAAPTCASVTYTQTPGPIAWGNLPNDGSTVTTAYICIQNSSSARTASVTTSALSPATGVTILYNGAASLTTPSIASAGTFLITVTLTVATSVPATTAVTYTTTIQ